MNNSEIMRWLRAEKRFWILIFLRICWNISETWTLKITHLSVPKIVDVRQTAILTCAFDLESSKLYSVKWYKDDLEFCRFMPDGSPQRQIFGVKGVHLAADSCNVTTVVMTPLAFDASGLYTCEVSTEAPYFKTVHATANMSVWGIPEKNPTISGIKNVYGVGDFVEGNCTSDASYPPSEMDWYVNDNKVEAWQLEEYPAFPLTQTENGEFHLKKTVLGVSFQVDHSHFAGKGNTMALKCVARVKDISRQTLRVSKLADLDLEKIAQGLYGNLGISLARNAERTSLAAVLMGTILIILS